MFRLICSLFIMNFALAHSNHEERISELEAQYLELLNKPTITPFEADSINIGGYLNMTATQVVPADGLSRGLVDEVELGLIISGQVNDKLSFFTHIEFEQEKKQANANSPRRNFNEVDIQTEPEDMYLEYRVSNLLAFQMGALITPFGVSNMEHFDFLRWQNEKPQALRESSDDFVFFDDHVNGFNVFGSLFTGNNTYTYYLYTGTNNMDHNDMMVGARLQHRYDNQEGYIQYGLSYQSGAKFEEHDHYQAQGVDIRLRWQRFEARMEYFNSVTNSGGANYQEDDDILSYSYYIEPWYHLVDNKHILYGRFDYIKDGLGINKTDTDFNAATEAEYYPVRKNEYTIGYNFLPYSYWRLSIGYTIHDYVGDNNKLNGEQADYQTYEFGTVLSF